MLTKELDTAIAAARKAGETVLTYYSRNIIEEEKLGADNYSEPVTAADRAASRVIVEALRTAFPADAVLSEEEKDDSAARTLKRRVWIIDPIDGTRGFINRDGDFAIQIGLAEDGEPTLGVVYIPVYDVLYYASKGSGAFAVTAGSEPKAVYTSAKTDFTRMSIATSRDHRSPRATRINQFFGIKNEERRGSIGIKVGLIVEQKCDLYINLSPRTKFWDTCGPQMILEEAGGALTDMFGERIRYDIEDVQNNWGVIASNGVSHDAIIEKLEPLLVEFGKVKMKVKS